jgi:hypothetical protein
MGYRKRSQPQYASFRSKGKRTGIAQVVSIPAKPQYIKQWQVQSHSDPSTYYTVSLAQDGHWECSCPQWIFRRKECKHIQEAKRFQSPSFRKFASSKQSFFINEDGVKQFTLT